LSNEGITLPKKFRIKIFSLSFLVLFLIGGTLVDSVNANDYWTVSEFFNCSGYGIESQQKANLGGVFTMSSLSIDEVNDLTIYYTSEPGTATPGEDYVPAGSFKHADMSIPIIDDGVIEGPEFFYITVYSLDDNFEIVGGENHIVYIEDDDAADQSDLSVSIEFKRDISKYGSGADSNTVYGTDLVIYTINVANLGPKDVKDVQAIDKLPVDVNFVASNGQYDSSSGIWLVGDLAKDESKQLQITVKVVNSGEIENTVTVVDNLAGDDNDEQSVSFTAKNPVVLVHGFNSNPSDCWSNIISRFYEEGIPNYAFSYYPALDDFVIYANMFGGWLKGTLDVKEDYTGKIDIVCHSMGALVTRYWMAQNNHENADHVGQWIGIGPVNSGAAVTDVWNQKNLRSLDWVDNTLKWYKAALHLINIAVPLGSDAAINMQTTDPEILALNSAGPYGNGIEADVKYSIIVGTHASEVSLGKKIPIIPTVARIGDKYTLTYKGDGVVANVQSILPGVPVTEFVGVSHTKLPGNSDVINNVIQILST
jgi:uncharacterized repeat protein (TIGR01451 family)